MEGQWDLSRKKLEINHQIPRRLRSKWPRELEFYIVVLREPQGILNDGGGVRLALKNSEKYPMKERIHFKTLPDQ